MRRVPKTLIAAVAVFLVVVGLAACGGGDSSGSTTPGADQAQAESKSSQETVKQNDVKSGSGSEGQSGYSGPSASDFTAKHYNDSGGGSKQFVVKGGDNSIQEFGEEADTTELKAAAVVLHNFLDARAEGNWAATCDFITSVVIESLEKLAAQAKQVKDQSCAGILEKLTAPANESIRAEAEKANVRSLRIKGEQAFVIYTAAKGIVLAQPMANESGDWKVASLAPTPLS